MDAFDLALRDRLGRLAGGVPMTVEHDLRRSRDPAADPRARQQPRRRGAPVLGGLAAAVVLLVGVGGVALTLTHAPVPAREAQRGQGVEGRAAVVRHGRCGHDAVRRRILRYRREHSVDAPQG
jgi:hypothetical protein